MDGLGGNRHCASAAQAWTAGVGAAEALDSFATMGVPALGAAAEGAETAR